MGLARCLDTAQVSSGRDPTVRKRLWRRRDKEAELSVLYLLDRWLFIQLSALDALRERVEREWQHVEEAYGTRSADEAVSEVGEGPGGPCESPSGQCDFSWGESPTEARSETSSAPTEGGARSSEPREVSDVQTQVPKA